jgi:serine/threonine protein kinase
MEQSSTFGDSWQPPPSVVKWPDIPLSTVAVLPKLPKSVVLENPQCIAVTNHSHVYKFDLRERDGAIKPAILKLFSKDQKERYTREVIAYRHLCHFNVPSLGVVPNVYGVLPSINRKQLREMLGDAKPEGVQISVPASAVLLEYIEGTRPTADNMTYELAQKAIDGLRAIHEARVLHKDIDARNILVQPAAGKVVWIDFSIADDNEYPVLAHRERTIAKEHLYGEVVTLSLSL